MGSLNISPKLPVDPQAARAAGLRPSIPSLWPADPQRPAAGRVRLPASLVRLVTLFFALLPSDAGAPSPAMLAGGLINSSVGTTAALAFASAAALAAFALSGRSDSAGITQ